jgi:WD40 repeat protein/mono/diheme cytochrome c family protein
MKAWVLAMVLCAAAAAQEVSYARDIAPIFAARCIGCHATGVKMGSFESDNYEAVMRGGANGPVIVAGRGADSKLVLMLTGQAAPAMPMGAPALAAGEIEIIRKWIDAGAPGPTAAEAAKMRESAAAAAPAIAPKGPVKPRIYALAFHPQRKWIALGGYKEVRLATPAGAVAHTLGGHTDAVRAVAFSRDGRWLAAAGGLPARRGEVKIWNLETRAVAAAIAGHDDAVYAVAFSPDGRWIATASYDKLVRLWDASTGAEVRTLKDHIDAVYALAFTPDGKRLVSGAADRTVKIWDPATGARLYSLSEPLDGVNAIAIDPSGTKVAAGGLDKTIRIWSLGETGGTLIESLMAHEDAILRLAWSPDGRTLASAAADRTLKFFRAADLSELYALPGQSDWTYGLEFSPDGSVLAVGRFDGSLALVPASRLSETPVASTR